MVRFFILFFKEINTFMQQRCITLIKSESKHNVTKDLDFKQMLIFYSSKNPKKKHSLHTNMKQHICV